MSGPLQVQFAGTGEQVIINIPGEGPFMVRGLTVPTDGTAGYAIGCMFIQTDGSTGTTLYLNEGSRTSCDFNSLN